jgi:hypothetical protein
MDCSMVDMMSSGGRGTIGSAVDGMYEVGSIVTSGPSGLLVWVSLLDRSIGPGEGWEASYAEVTSSRSCEIFRRYSWWW